MQYEPIQPGLFRLHTPAGPLTVPTSEADLQAAGHVPLTSPGSPALALSDSGGQGNVPDVPPSLVPALGGPGSSAGGAPAQPIDQDIQEGAPNAPEMAPRDEQTTNLTKATRPIEPEDKPKGEKEKAAGGTKKIRVTLPASRAGGGGKPQDVRVGYKVEKTNLNPADIEAAEAADADASIDRKLSAQSIADKQATRGEAQGAALGRDIRREERAIQEQRARDEAQAADYRTRQQAIDSERAEVEGLKVNPRQYFDNMPGWAKVLSAIAMIGSGAAAGVGRGNGNAALDAINQEVERNIDSQKQNIGLRRQGLAARESELERLTKLYGSPEAAESELRDRQRALIQKYAEKQAVDAGAIDAADNLRTAFADWDTQRAKDRLTRQGALAGTVQEEWKRTYPGAGGGKPKHLSAGQEKVAGLIGTVNKLGQDIADIPDETSTALPGSGHIGRRALKAASDFIGGEGAYEQNFRTDEENETTRRLQTTKSLLKGMLSQATEQGVITGPEQPQYENAIDSAHDAAGIKRATGQVLGLLRAKAGAMGAPDVTPEEDFEVQR